MTAGFLQTFGFLQQREDEMFAPGNLLKYYAWRLTKFVPLIATVLMFSMFIMPFLGSGPIWALYEKVMSPCQDNWWTVLLQINNFYPGSSFDDKCMPWAWFIPALTQMSLLLPLFVYVYQACLPNRFLLRILFSLFLLLCCAVSGLMTYLYNEGAMPVQIKQVHTHVGDVNSLTELDFSFYNDVFMNPAFHLVSYFLGFGIAIVYRRFLIESQLNKNLPEGEDPELSRASRFFTLISENARLRYVNYTLGTFLIAGALAWTYPFMNKAED